MTVYHIVLLKLKPEVTKEQADEFVQLAKAMVGKVPGLIRLDGAPPLAITAHRSQGYGIGIVAVLEKPEDVPVYAGHSAHVKVNEYREVISTDTLAYDMEF